ncbi:hypothetical protein HK102_001888 [Quaeritorhiza haematococci]|nr:hypothetical protein HK102_001888 [Quaeritorhiza haematococci]
MNDTTSLTTSEGGGLDRPAASAEREMHNYKATTSPTSLLAKDSGVDVASAPPEAAFERNDAASARPDEASVIASKPNAEPDSAFPLIPDKLSRVKADTSSSRPPLNRPRRIPREVRRLLVELVQQKEMYNFKTLVKSERIFLDGTGENAPSFICSGSGSLLFRMNHAVFEEEKEGMEVIMKVVAFESRDEHDTEPSDADIQSANDVETEIKSIHALKLLPGFSHPFLIRIASGKLPRQLWKLVPQSDRDRFPMSSAAYFAVYLSFDAGLHSTAFRYKRIEEYLSVLLQIIVNVAAAEKNCELEHRDGDECAEEKEMASNTGSAARREAASQPEQVLMDPCSANDDDEVVNSSMAARQQRQKFLRDMFDAMRGDGLDVDWSRYYPVTNVLHLREYCRKTMWQANALWDEITNRNRRQYRKSTKVFRHTIRNEKKS